MYLPDSKCMCSRRGKRRGRDKQYPILVRKGKACGWDRLGRVHVLILILSLLPCNCHSLLLSGIVPRQSFYPFLISYRLRSQIFLFVRKAHELNRRSKEVALGLWEAYLIWSVLDLMHRLWELFLLVPSLQVCSGGQTHKGCMLCWWGTIHKRGMLSKEFLYTIPSTGLTIAPLQTSKTFKN
jgi:hypothetical protein